MRNQAPFSDADKTFPQAVVAADHVEASKAGKEMLAAGGNVVDAAVATSFALSVVRPASCGIGGGGFMVIWNADAQTAVALDYREQAPAASTRDMFVNAKAAPEPASVRGGSAAGIPGTVAGLCHAAEHYGTLPLKQLLAPAIRLARQGVAVDEHDLSAQQLVLGRLKKYEGYEQRFARLKSLYLNNRTAWKVGDLFYSPQLPTLEKIAAEGRDGFYTGAVAADIVQTSQQSGGRMTADDLAGMQPRLRSVLKGQFAGHRLLTMPPPSSGGIALLQTLQTLEHWERQSGSSLKELGHNSTDYIHVLAEALKHAFADRAEFLGDTDFADVPLQRLLDDDYHAEMASKIDLQKTLPSADYGRFFAADDSGTSHFSVIDSRGNAVACTETINLTYGSFEVVPNWGIVLNDEMDDFAAKPGVPNAFGLMQSEANAVEPGKKPLSSMTPTIVVKDGRAQYVSGASGGPRIITATIQSILNHLVFGMTPAEAVSAARVHHQWSPNQLRLEKRLHEMASSLQAKGHEIVKSGSLAANQSASRSADGLRGGSDPRKHGHPAGL